MPHVILLKDYPHHLTIYENNGTKISPFKLFSELGKIWKCNLGFSKIPISNLLIGKNLEIYAVLEQHFKIQMLNLWMSWGNICHLKLNIYDGDILFPKILRIYQWIGKNIFHWGKCNEPMKLIRECVKSEI